MKREYYSDSIETFLRIPADQILGRMAAENQFSLELTDRKAWIEEIAILKDCLSKRTGTIFFEYSIPRL